MELHKLTIHELCTLLERGEVSAVEVTSSIYERIKRLEPEVAAYVLLSEEKAMEEARSWDLRGFGDGAPVLAGVPLAVKDVICTKGVRTTCGSRILANFVPPYDATVARQLKEAGGVLLGKTTWTNLQWGPPTKTQPLDQPVIHGI